MQLLSNVCGPQIRKFRDRLGMTQEDLAAKLQLAGLDISRSSLSKVEAQLTWLGDKELFYYSAVLKVPIPDLYPKIDPDLRVHAAVTELVIRRRTVQSRQKKSPLKAAPKIHRVNPRSHHVVEQARCNRAYRNSDQENSRDSE